MTRPPTTQPSPLSRSATVSRPARWATGRWVWPKCTDRATKASLWTRCAVVPIPGTRRSGRIDENIGSLGVDLDSEQQRLLNDLASLVVGARSDSADPNWVSDTRETKAAR